MDLADQDGGQTGVFPGYRRCPHGLRRHAQALVEHADLRLSHLEGPGGSARVPARCRRREGLQGANLPARSIPRGLAAVEDARHLFDHAHLPLLLMSLAQLSHRSEPENDSLFASGTLGQQMVIARQNGLSSYASSAPMIGRLSTSKASCASSPT